MSDQLLRIVPCAHEPHTYCKTQGTKVLLPDDTRVPGVYRVELVADADDIWRATVHCHVSPPSVTALAYLRSDNRIAWWRKVLLWLAGVKDVEDTNFDDAARGFRRLGLVRDRRRPGRVGSAGK